MSTKFTQPCIFCLILAALSFPAHAEIYKWVDANGVTQYTQAPPPDPSKAKNIQQEIDLSAGKAQKPTADSTASSTEEEGKDEKPLSVQNQEGQTKHREFCDRQKAALNQLLANTLIRWKAEDEQEHILTAKEREEKIALLDKNVKEMCNKDVLPEKPTEVK